MTKPILKITSATILISIFSASLLFIIQTPKANAQLGGPAFETNPLVLTPLAAIAGSTAATAATLAAKTATDDVLTLKEIAQKLAQEILKKIILDRLVDATVSWIKNGGKGSIITDWNAFFKKAADDAVGLVAQDIGLGILCSPFNLQVRLLVAQPPQFSQQITCSLTGIVANINDFYNDFRNGSWIAYQEMWRPQNNFYGATLLALDEADRRQTEAQNAAYAEGVAGGGFLSIKKCDSNGKNCVIETPGTFVAGAAKKYLIDTPADRFIGADSMVAYTAAIIDALVNRFIESGVKALQGK